MAEEMNPGSSVDAVRTTCVLAAEDHQEKTKRRHLDRAEIINLVDVLFRAKQALLGPACPCVTPAEMKRFLSDVFNMWASTRAHQLPDPNTITTGMKDKTIAIGTLTKDVPTEAEMKAEGERRGLSAKTIGSRAFKGIRKNWTVRTANVHRRAGAQVMMRASLKKDTEVNTQSCDERGRFLSPNIGMTWFKGMDERTAYFQAFCAFDNYEATTINNYNLRVAIFIARNRITTWGNGFLPNIRPVYEPFELLIELCTIRDKAESVPNGAMSALAT